MCSADYKVKDDGEKGRASKCVQLYRLPRVLVLHLKRFTHGLAAGTGKVHKPVRFDATLQCAPPAHRPPSRAVPWQLGACTSFLAVTDCLRRLACIHGQAWRSTLTQCTCTSTPRCGAPPPAQDLSATYALCGVPA